MSNKTVFVPVDPEGFGCGILFGLIIRFWKEILIAFIILFACFWGWMLIGSINDYRNTHFNKTELAYWEDISAAATVNAMEIIEIPSITPSIIPSETPIPDTQQGTILEVGQTWWQDGLAVTLQSAGLSEGSDYYGVSLGIETCFTLSNLRPYSFTLDYSTDNFRAQDNYGRGIPYLSCIYDYRCRDWKEVSRVIQSGETVSLGTIRSNIMASDYDCNYVEFDTADPAINSIVVTITNISSIAEAKWLIPVNH